MTFTLALFLIVMAVMIAIQAWTLVVMGRTGRSSQHLQCNTKWCGFETRR